jgi:rhodanese-related sulfurtransferase
MSEKRNRKFYVIASLIILLCSMAIVHGAYTNITPTNAFNLIQTNPDIIILDVRTTSEYNTGYIENAILIPVSQLETRINELDNNKTVLVYCKSGGRSATAANILVNNGFGDVYNLQGGITAWKNSGLPIVMPNQTPSIIITYPLNSASLSGNVVITGTSQDEDGTIQKVDIKIDEGTWITANGTTTWFYSWDTMLVTNGEHEISARSYDGQDYSEITSITVTVFNQMEQQSKIEINPGTITVFPGQTFVIEITVNPKGEIAGAQFDLSFDPTLLMVDSVTEGNLFTGYTTYFNPGIIDNINGRVTGVFDVIITQGASISDPGVLAYVHFTTKISEGISFLNLSDVVAGDPDGLPLPLAITNGSVTVQLNDTESPESNVDAIFPQGYYQKNLPLEITVTAIDDTSGVKTCSLFYRYSFNNATWTDWMMYGVNISTAPYIWFFSAPNGSGYYEFYSRAIDNADNVEDDPIIPDASCQIYPNWDVNKDQRINILDIIIIGQNWGVVYEPCCIPADVNSDGDINILDIIMVGQHWTG